LAEKFRELALHESMDPLTEALVMFAARREHLIHVIEPALARGDVVLCDRFTDATFAYQGGGREFDWGVLQTLEKMVQHVPAHLIRQPDLTIWFDLSPEVAAQRLSKARIPDKFESQPVSFFQKVRAGYAKRMAETPSRFAQISADQSRDDVWRDVLSAVENAYK
jgi:dTMP kinase